MTASSAGWCGLAAAVSAASAAGLLPAPDRAAVRLRRLRNRHPVRQRSPGRARRRLARGPHRRRRGAAEEATRAVIEVASALADELRAGASPLDALRAASAGAGPLVTPLHRVAAAAGYGVPVPAGLREIAATPGAEGLRAVAACWTTCAASGAGFAAVMRGVARSLRERERLRAEARARLATARTSAWLLAGLPAVGLLLGQGIGARPVQVLFGSGLGVVALVLAAGLEAAGLAWMAALLRRAEPP